MTSEPAARARDQAGGMVQIALSPEEDFRDIIRRLEDIRIPPTRASAGSIRFAVLELINNSIRAHREKGEGRDVEVVFVIADGRLSVSIRDFGGGFDLRSLPYDVAADPEAVDLRSAAFEEYQRKNGYRRFGMGLYVARKTFDTLQVMFLDSDGNPRQWEHGSVAGTVINLTAQVDAHEPARDAGNGR